MSTTEQETANQVRALQEYAARRGLTVVHVYEVQASAWKGAHLAALSRVKRDARTQGITVLLVWALDRLTRQGPADTLNIVSALGQQGVDVWSFQEPWTETTGPMRELLLSIVGWVAKQESALRSERVKAGLAKRRADGLPVGRLKGAKDKRKRRRTGYYRRWERGAA